jgi:hypothetical protein
MNWYIKSKTGILAEVICRKEQESKEKLLNLLDFICHPHGCNSQPIIPDDYLPRIKQYIRQKEVAPVEHRIMYGFHAILSVYWEEYSMSPWYDVYTWLRLSDFDGRCDPLDDVIEFLQELPDLVNSSGQPITTI